MYVLVSAFYMVLVLDLDHGKTFERRSRLQELESGLQVAFQFPMARCGCRGP